MATYVNDLRLKEIATGDESGTWGASTNTNLELIAEAFSFGTEAITTNADTHTTTIADGATDPGRSIYLKYTGTLDSACTITIGPNTVSKLWFIENGTSGSQNIIISQGSGANVTVPAGEVKAIYSDGAGSGAAMVDAFANLKVSDAAQTNITSLGTLTTLTVDDITIDGSTISDSGDLTLDVGGDIIFDADGSTISMKDGGTNRITFNLDSTPDLVLAGGNASITASTSDADLSFIGNDGGSDVTALTLDMSDAGTAKFNHNIQLNSAGAYISLNNNDDSRIAGDGDSIDFNLWDNSSAYQTRMTILDTGKVGINETSPANNLHLGISSGGQGVLVKSTGDHSGLLQFNVNRSNSNRVLGQLLGTWNGTDVCDIQLKTADDTTNKDNGQITFSTSTANNLSEKMRLNDQGKLGVGTTTPQSGVHIAEGGSGADGGSVLTLSFTGFGSIVNNDDLGSVHFGGVTSGGVGIHNAAKIMVEGDGTWASNDYPTRMVFFTTTDGASSATEKMKIDNLGELSTTHAATAHTNGLNIINSQAGGYGSALKLQSERSDTNAIVTAARIRTEGAEAWNADNAVSSAFIFESVQDNSLNERFRVTSSGFLTLGTSTAGAVFTVTNAMSTTTTLVKLTDAGGTGTHTQIDFNNTNGQVGTINTSGSSTSYNTSSDARLKNVTGKARGLEVINKLNPVSFNWKADDKADEGLLAQEVLDIVPNAVSGSEEDMYQMDYSKLVTPLIAAIQEQQTQIDALQSEINILKGE
jgi:hypothetical protein